MTARLSLAQNVFGSLEDHSRDCFWILRHRKMARRESRVCCAQPLCVCLLHGRRKHAIVCRSSLTPAKTQPRCRHRAILRARWPAERVIHRVAEEIDQLQVVLGGQLQGSLWSGSIMRFLRNRTKLLRH